MDSVFLQRRVTRDADERDELLLLLVDLRKMPGFYKARKIEICRMDG